MKNKKFGLFALIIGLILLIIGLFLLKTSSNPQVVMLVLPYIFIGLGCGIFGHGMGEVINNCLIKKYPQRQKEILVEKNDERNIAISNHAKAKAYDAMIYIFGALMLIFVFMNAELAVILLLMAAYLIVVGVFIFYLSKNQKEM